MTAVVPSPDTATADPNPPDPALLVSVATGLRESNGVHAPSGWNTYTAPSPAPSAPTNAVEPSPDTATDVPNASPLVAPGSASVATGARGADDAHDASLAT